MAEKPDPTRQIFEQWDGFHEDAFQPSPEELAFLRSTTGLKDADELTRHVVALQRKAIQVFPYPCIFKYYFTKANIVKLEGFKKALQLVKERPDALLLDIGCCFGADARKAVLEGFPATQIVASDLHAEFWQLGRELFRDDEQRVPIRFLAGDVFDPDFLAPSSPGQLAAPSPPLPLSSVTTLTALRRRLSAIHASYFFHLFPRSQQEQLAALLAGLLLPKRGSVLFGFQMGADEQRYGQGEEYGKFAHTCESWKGVWRRALKSVGWEGEVDVRCALGEAPYGFENIGLGSHNLYWSVELL